jgi:hypothetical protein
MPIPGLDARGAIPELKLRLKFCCSWTWYFLLWVFFFYFDLFFLPFFVCLILLFCFIIVGFKFLFYFIISIFFFYLCTINFTITILSSLLSPSSLSLLLLCYNPLLSFPTILSAFSHPLCPLPSLSPSILPQPVTTLPLPPTYSPPADKPTIPTIHNPNPLKSLIQAPYTTTTKI